MINGSLTQPATIPKVSTTRRLLLGLTHTLAAHRPFVLDAAEAHMFTGIGKLAGDPSCNAPRPPLNLKGLNVLPKDTVNEGMEVKVGWPVRLSFHCVPRCT